MAGKAIRFSSDQRIRYRFGILDFGSMGAQGFHQQAMQLRQIDPFVAQFEPPMPVEPFASIVRG